MPIDSTLERIQNANNRLKLGSIARTRGVAKLTHKVVALRLISDDFTKRAIARPVGYTRAQWSARVIRGIDFARGHVAFTEWPGVFASVNDPIPVAVFCDATALWKLIRRIRQRTRGAI